MEVLLNPQNLPDEAVTGRRKKWASTSGQGGQSGVPRPQKRNRGKRDTTAGKSTQTVKKVHQLPVEEVERVFSGAPFVARLGMRLVKLDLGTCETELDVEPWHLQQDGFVHAGVQATMADHTAGVAATTLLEKGRIVLTVEFKINLLRTAKGDRLACHSRVLKPGSRIIVVESEVFCGDEATPRLVSKTAATMAVVFTS